MVFLLNSHRNPAPPHLRLQTERSSSNSTLERRVRLCVCCRVCCSLIWCRVVSLSFTVRSCVLFYHLDLRIKYMLVRGGDVA
jgi:hypothetical protein